MENLYLYPALKRVILIMFVFALLIRFSSAQTWVQQNSTTTNTLHAVYFIDIQKGFIVGDAGTVLYTLNAGQSWLSITGLTNEDLNDVAFLNASTGIIVGDNGRIFRSVNGGTQWSQISSGTSLNIRTVSLGDGGRVYAAGNDGLILTSTNYGINWGIKATGVVRYRGSSSKNSTKAWIVGENGLISVSNNGGESFTTQISNTTSDLHNIFMFNELIGYIGGQNSTILYTGNGGTQWTSRSSGINQGVNGIHFSNINTGWAACNAGAVYITFNAGISWVAENSGTVSELNDIYFPDINRGWAVGANGTIIKRSGTIGITQISGNIPAEFLLKQNYPNPFNPTTNITFHVAKSGLVSLIVSDVNGKELERLVEQNLQPGIYEIDWSADNFSTGVYYYRLTSGEYIETRKMVLLK